MLGIENWDTYISGVGACCYKFFAETLYFDLKILTYDPNLPKTVVHMTDFEMLNILGIKLVDVRINGGISIYDSRVKLISLFDNYVTNNKQLQKNKA